MLQTGEMERVGSSKTRRVDVRILAATNADVNAELAAGRFRQDLLIARIQWRIVDLFNRLATENSSPIAKYPPHSSSVGSRNRAVRFKPLPTNPAMFHHIP